MLHKTGTLLKVIVKSTFKLNHLSKNQGNLFKGILFEGGKNVSEEKNEGKMVKKLIY